MARLVLYVLTAFSISSMAIAQDNETPASLGDFFKPGMKVGIHPYEGSGDIRVVIFSEKAFSIQQDGRAMEFDALAAKYPEVAAAKKEAADLGPTAYMGERGRMLKFGEPEIRGLRIDRQQLLCSISHVGDDYILVQSGTGRLQDRDTGSRRKVYAKHCITSIDWQDGPRLSLGYPVVQGKTGRTSR